MSAWPLLVFLTLLTLAFAGLMLAAFRFLPPRRKVYALIALNCLFLCLALAGNSLLRAWLQNPVGGL